MKKDHLIPSLKPLLPVILAFLVSSVLVAQEEVAGDTIPQGPVTEEPVVQDTIVEQPAVKEAPPQDSPPQEKAAKEKKERKRKDAIKVYGGVTFNDLDVSPDMYGSNGLFGYRLGVSYKRGKFLYYEIGARYSRSTYELNDLINPGAPYGEGSFSVGTVDLPITGGINFTSFVDRIVGVRIFAGIVPAFRTGVRNNNLGITKSDVNSFNLHGQAGFGLDVAFLFFEAGFDYGFSDLLSNDIQSNPRQVYFTMGFRF